MDGRRETNKKIIEEFRGETLVPRALLRAITKRIVEAVHPERVILFGSYAYGEPTLDSDIDLLVVMKSTKRPIENAERISRLFPDRRFGMDIMVRTPRQLRECLKLGDYFMKEITEQGSVLYERRRNHRA